MNFTFKYPEQKIVDYDLGLFDPDNGEIYILLHRHYDKMIDNIIETIIHEHIHKAIQEVGPDQTWYTDAEEQVLNKLLYND